jgi:hypothetical protein
MAPKPRRRLDPTPSDPRGDPTPPQPGPVGSAVVPLVGVDLARSLAPLSRRRPDRRNVIQDGCEHDGVAGVGGGHRRRQRQPTAVADQVELGPRLATIDGICAHVVPPRLARTLMVSTVARDHAKQLRSGIVRRRPPYQARGGNGRSGSTIAHSSSGTRSSTMVDMTVKPPILPRGERNAVLAIDLPNESSARVRSPQIPLQHTSPPADSRAGFVVLATGPPAAAR